MADLINHFNWYTQVEKEGLIRINKSKYKVVYLPNASHYITSKKENKDIILENIKLMVEKR